MSKNRKVTGKSAATKASKTISTKSTGKSSKTAGGSALSQRKAPAKQTGKQAASASSKTLQDARTSKASKSAAGSALSQTPRRKGKCSAHFGRGNTQCLGHLLTGPVVDFHQS